MAWKHSLGDIFFLGTCPKAKKPEELQLKNICVFFVCLKQQILIILTSCFNYVKLKCFPLSLINLNTFHQACQNNWALTKYLLEHHICEHSTIRNLIFYFILPHDNLEGGEIQENNLHFMDEEWASGKLIDLLKTSKSLLGSF